MTRNEFARSLLSRFPALTAREADVVAGVAAGLSNVDIADRLSLTEKTVKNILSPVPFKMGLADDRGGSVRVRLALVAHGCPTLE